MNNRGQTLVLFVLILPIIASLLAFFIDISMVSYQKNHLKGVIESNMRVILNDNIRDEERIRKILLENDLHKFQVEVGDEALSISVDETMTSLFGRILNADTYRLKESFKGDYILKKIILE